MWCLLQEMCHLRFERFKHDGTDFLVGFVVSGRSSCIKVVCVCIGPKFGVVGNCGRNLKNVLLR